MSDFLATDDPFILDDRTLLSRLLQLKEYCKKIPFGGQTSPPSWAEFMFAHQEELADPLDPGKLLDPGQLVWLYQNPEQANGRMTPHQAFLLAFLRMQETPRDLLNQLPAAHRQLYYRKLLGLQERPALADQVAVSFRLNQTTPALYLPVGTLLDAGQDSQGHPAHYRLQQSLLANHAQWTDLRWCHSTDNSAPKLGRIAYDRDNGVPWPQQGIRLFEEGAADAPLATGRVVSSAVLAMSGGIREITVTLAQAADAAAISAEVSSNSEWLRLEKGIIKADSTTELVFSLGADAGPVTPASGLDGFHEATPLLKLYRHDGEQVPEVISLSVNVQDLPDVFFSTDDGSASIDARSYPFGNEPILGVGLNLVAADWYGKPGAVTVSLQPEWIDLPSESFVKWYEEYTVEVASQSQSQPIITNDEVFKVQAVIGSRGSAIELEGKLASLFKQNPVVEKSKVSSTVSLPSSADYIIQIEIQGLLGNTVDSQDPQDWPSWLRLELAEQDFLHAHYWRVLASQKAGQDPIQINPPYTPQWKRLHVGYSCIDVAPRKQYQLTPFGHVLASAPPAQIVDEKYRWREEERSELYLGFRNLSPKEDLSLHWQLQTPRTLDISWHYLTQDNCWAALDASVTDHTEHLFRSGLWSATMPQDAATNAPMMPSGRVWLRALMVPVPYDQAGEPSEVATSDYPWLRGLHTNSGTAVRVNDEAPDALVFDGSLAPGSITQPLQKIEGLESIDQPWPSQGGRAPESEVEFTQRVAKQLDHRGRALTWRDMKTLLLARYPEIYDALPVFLSAGQTQAGGRRQCMLVIPANGQMDNTDPLCPVFNPARLKEMTQYLCEHASLWLELELLNPLYRKVAISYQVDFTAGMNAAYGDKQLQLALAQHYMPWMCDQTSAVQLGNHLDYYGMVKFIQQLPFVDSVKELKLKDKQGNFQQGNIQSGENEVLLLSLPVFDAETTAQAVDQRNDL